MMFKRTLLAASLGLLFAGNALAVTNGNFSQPGLSGWDTLGDVARSFGGAVLTTIDGNESRIDGQPDFAFVVIDGALSTLAFAADAAIPSVPFDWTTGASTGVHGFSHVYTTGGISSVAFGVVDMGNYTTTSALWLDNVSVTPVPEPKDWMLMLAGLGLVGMMVSRSRRRMM